MTSIIERRRSLHRSVQDGHKKNQELMSQLCRLQPLANIGSASSMIAHEINNLLTPLGTYADLALHNIDDSALVEKALTKAVLNCRRVSQVMESVLAMASGKKQAKEECDVKALVEDIFTCLCRDFSKDGIKIKIDIPGNLKVNVIPIQIQQVFMNLILNAREAMLSRGGTLTIKALKNGDSIQIDVKDSGHGIAPENLGKIFTSFFSTKESDASTTECCGTGLGLAFCRTVIDVHEGSISVESQVNQGTTFHILLPGVRN